MKMSYEEFNELQTQQYIRDTAQKAWYELDKLLEMRKRKDNAAILNCMEIVKEIEFYAIREIRKMIEGGNDETN